MLMLLLFAACSGGKPAADDSATSATDYEHALVPEQYRGSWDVESANCEDAIFYWAFEGGVDEGGNLSGKESWYWFFADEGSGTDCVDVFDVSGQEEDTFLETPCFSCDREFTATWTLGETGCSWDGYENLLDNDDTDRIDEEEYEFIFLLDSHNGDELLPQMNVWSYVQDDQSRGSYNDRAISIGTYAPTGSDSMGAADLDWAIGDGVCITIESG